MSYRRNKFALWFSYRHLFNHWPKIKEFCRIDGLYKNQCIPRLTSLVIKTVDFVDPGDSQHRSSTHQWLPIKLSARSSQCLLFGTSTFKTDLNFRQVIKNRIKSEQVLVRLLHCLQTKILHTHTFILIFSKINQNTVICLGILNSNLDKQWLNNSLLPYWLEWIQSPEIPSPILPGQAPPGNSSLSTTLFSLLWELLGGLSYVEFRGWQLFRWK